jgi:hypothetical protein
MRVLAIAGAAPAPPSPASLSTGTHSARGGLSGAGLGRSHAVAILRRPSQPARNGRRRLRTGPVRAGTPRKITLLQRLIAKSGGGSGIRTRDTVSGIHTFQACAFNHSATPPKPAGDHAGAGRGRWSLAAGGGSVAGVSASGKAENATERGLCAARPTDRAAQGLRRCGGRGPRHSSAWLPGSRRAR